MFIWIRLWLLTYRATQLEKLSDEEFKVRSVAVLRKGMSLLTLNARPRVIMKLGMINEYIRWQHALRAEREGSIWNSNHKSSKPS